MRIKPLLCALGLLSVFHVHANQPIQKDTDSFSRVCIYKTTDSPLDLAIFDDGYFTLSDREGGGERLYTVYGHFMLDHQGALIHMSGLYPLKMPSKEYNPSKLEKIQIPLRPLPPRETSKVHVQVEFPTTIHPIPAILADSDRITTAPLYDSVGVVHSLRLEYRALLEDWLVSVYVDNKFVDEGILIFNPDGSLKRQKGLSSIKWNSEYKEQKFDINFAGSTSDNALFKTIEINSNGYPPGSLSGINVNNDGEIFVEYTNGVSKKLKGRIAVTHFLNSNYLDNVDSYLYRETNKSGKPLTHWTYGEGRIRSYMLGITDCNEASQ